MPDGGSKEPPLAYERPAAHYATRRQFRWLLALVLVHMLITFQSAYFPGLIASVKQRWADYQQKRERAAAVKATLALEQQAMGFAEAPGKVVWDENPDTAAKLLGGGGYKKISVERLQYMPLLAHWPRGAAASPPAVVAQLFARRSFPTLPGEEIVEPDQYALAFLHGLKSHGGTERLVYVYVQGELSLTHSDGRGSFEGPWFDGRENSPGKFTLTKELRLVAVPCLPGWGEKPPAPVPTDHSSLLIHGRGAGGFLLHWNWEPRKGDKPEQIRIEGREMFRFYAGQPDPSDKSRFTIDYDVDGQRGTIRGQLKNDGTIEFKPSTGTTIGSRWYPGRASTRPAGQ